MDSHHDELSTGLIKRRETEYSFERFRLVVTAGSDVGLEAQSDTSELNVGTAPGNQLVLRDATISRHHCAIVATPRGHLLKDLRSTNGTWLGEYRVDAAYLTPSAIVRVGRTSLRFEPLGERVYEKLSDEEQFGRILGKSAAMRHLFALLPRIAASESTVLLQGETGSGKGLIAEAIHMNSSRRDGPFVVVDCGSIPPTLIETEILGHERGAFTGAQASRAGSFELARGGTIFLDEIGELPLDVQPKLLRALDERVIKRVGGSESIRLDARVIAATNRDLRKEVNKGAFRSDLFYRLNTVPLTVPPLRDRSEDVPLLVAHFYQQFASGGGAPTPPPNLVDAFGRREWPGNVRELRSAVECAVVLGGWDQDPSVAQGSSGVEEPATASEAGPRTTLSFRMAKDLAVSQWERQFIRDLVRHHGGNLSRAARTARMDRSHLRDLVRRYEISVLDDG